EREARLREALALWRGAPLADLAYEPVAQVEAARLDELRVAAQEELVEARLALGQHAELVPQLGNPAAAPPHREPPCRQPMPRPLPRRPPGRAAGALPAGAPRTRRPARDRTQPSPARAPSGDPPPGRRARPARPARAAQTGRGTAQDRDRAVRGHRLVDSPGR